MTMSYDASDNYGADAPAGDGLIPDQTTVRAKALTADLGYTSNDREQVAVQFKIIDGEYAGRTLTWYGYFGDETKGKKTPTEITIAALRACGWIGDDITNLEGIDREEVELVIVVDTYQGKTSNKVRWVNKPGGGLALKARMDDKQRKAFAARMAKKVQAVSAQIVRDEGAKNGSKVPF
jgi:hypothetical protein